MTEDFNMPVPQIGDTVLFSKDPGGSTGWTFGIVEEIGERNIGVWVPRCQGNWWRGNVRHVSDPIWKNERKRITLLEDDESGVFAIRDKDRELAEMRERVARLEELLLGAKPGLVPVLPKPKAEKPKDKPKKKDGPKSFDHLKPAVYDKAPSDPGVTVLPEVEETEEEVEVIEL